MLRRNFCGSLLAGGAISHLARSQQQPQARQDGPPWCWNAPTRGSRTRARCCSRSRPIPTTYRLSAAGTVAKLIKEGYTGYLVRATNDDMGDAPGLGTPGTIGDHVLGNERDNDEVARVLGLQDGTST